MSFRGRGRGRGRYFGGGGGGGFGYARQERFVEFPEIELPDTNDVKEERTLVVLNYRLQNFWKSSPYYFDETVSKEKQSMDIERYSDREKPKIRSERDSLDAVLQYGCENFPKELIGGSKRERKPKKVRWNADSDLQKLDLFEKLEQKYKGQEETGEKIKKEGEEEEDDEDEEAGEDEEDFSDDDYNQNIDFDDDEDDFNMDDGNDDEQTY